MNKIFFLFDDIEIEKCKCYCSIYPIDIKNINTKKIIKFTKASFGKKKFYCFTCCKDDEKVKLLCTILPKIWKHVKSFEENKFISFLSKDAQPLIKHMGNSRK